MSKKNPILGVNVIGRVNKPRGKPFPKNNTYGKNSKRESSIHPPKEFIDAMLGTSQEKKLTERKMVAEIDSLQLNNRYDRQKFVEHLGELPLSEIQKMVADPALCYKKLAICTVFIRAIAGDIRYVKLLWEVMYGPESKLLEIKVSDTPIHGMSPEEKKAFLANPVNVRNLSAVNNEIGKIRQKRDIDI